MDRGRRGKARKGRREGGSAWPGFELTWHWRGRGGVVTLVPARTMNSYCGGFGSVWGGVWAEARTRAGETRLCVCAFTDTHTHTHTHPSLEQRNALLPVWIVRLPYLDVPRSCATRRLCHQCVVGDSCPNVRGHGDLLCRHHAHSLHLWLGDGFRGRRSDAGGDGDASGGRVRHVAAAWQGRGEEDTARCVPGELQGAERGQRVEPSSWPGKGGEDGGATAVCPA